jgi:DNA repair exonuclease SbcCD nuclease subunit
MLENDTKVIDDVTFIGATLWTDMNKGDPLTMHAIEGMMNDFRIIRNDKRNFAAMSARDVVGRHARTLQYFRSVLAEQHDKKFVVVGHHSPSFKSVHESYSTEYLMNGGYHSDLSEFIMDHPQIKLWTHGHTHHPFDYMIGETRIVCNPRGYENDGYSEETGWDPTKILEI